MKISTLLISLGLVFAGIHSVAHAQNDAATSKSAADALQALKDARANLERSVRAIQQDPPKNEDLDAAHAAVERLKKAIDAAEVHQARSLEYAKAVLLARKEVREHGAYVEDRRSKIQLHELRRKIDAAVATMNDGVSRLSGGTPSPETFDAARAGISAVTKLLGEARALSSRDEGFAEHLRQVEAKVARQQSTVDDRWVQLSADKQRHALKETVQALDTTMAALAKAWSDAAYESADKAAAALSKRLEEGTPLEAKDKGYRADAAKARSELAKARKRMGELVDQAGLARVKDEVAPAYEELGVAAKALKARVPRQEQLDHAKTAALVVRKLVDKYEPQAARSAELRKYLDQIKADLVVVEAALHVGAITAAKADAVQALRSVERRTATDENFAEATGALLVLEKTLEAVTSKNPDVRAHVVEARKLIKEGRTTVEKRKQQVDLQRHRAKLNDARKTATDAVAQLQQGTPSTEQFNSAEDAVKQIDVVLEEGKRFLRIDGDYLKYARETKERVTMLNDRIAKRKIVVAAGEARGRLDALIAEAKQALENANRPDSTDADIAKATTAVEAVGQALETDAGLASQDARYAAHADRARNALGRLLESLGTATHARAFRKETVDALAAGIAASAAAASERDVLKKKAGFDSAVSYFKACVETGTRMVRETPALERTPVLIDGERDQGRNVMALCAARVEETAQMHNEAVGLARIEQSVKKAFDAAKRLEGKSRKKETLSHLEECIAEGMIVSHRWPELKDRKFAAADGPMTVPEMVKKCQAQRQAMTSR